MWNVKPGDLVVYVGPKTQLSPLPLEPQQIYTVSGFDKRPNLVLTLEERPELHKWAGVYWVWAWDIERFRPVTKPSIESLRSLIKNPDPVRVDA